jgi:hypothetical protein
MIHVFHNNQQEGPYSESQIRNMLATGYLSSVTPVWKKGMNDWAPLNTIIQCESGETATQLTPPPHPLSSPRQDIPHVEPANMGPKGVGGWLLLWCVAITIIGPLLSISQNSMSWIQAQPAFDIFPVLKTAVLFENIALTILVIYGFIVGCMVWGGNPNGRELSKNYLIIRFVGVIVIEIITLLLMTDMPSEVVSEVAAEVVGIFPREVLYFLIWWFYFKKSKRVRNTYGPE